MDIDVNQRVTLSSPAGVLKSKTAYDQLKPVKERSHSSVIESDLVVPTVPVCHVDNFFVDDSPTEDLPVITHKKRCLRKADVIVTGADPKCPRKLGTVNVSNQSDFQGGLHQMCQVITSGAWLTDEHINHAQATLRQSFPTIGGFQAVSVFEPEDCPLVGKPNCRFIQILNLGGNHWITVSNVHCIDNGQLYVYDSLYTGLSDLSQPSRDKFLRQVSYILQSTSPELSIEWVDMKKQTGSSDCGLFSIAAATVLSHGSKPQDCDWIQKRMRSHLVRCFRDGCVQLFPVTGVRRISRLVRCQKVPIFCHCRQPDLNDRFMVECAGCADWYHRECEDVPKRITARTIFMCRIYVLKTRRRFQLFNFVSSIDDRRRNLAAVPLIHTKKSEVKAYPIAMDSQRKLRSNEPHITRNRSKSSTGARFKVNYISNLCKEDVPFTKRSPKKQSSPTDRIEKGQTNKSKHLLTESVNKPGEESKIKDDIAKSQTGSTRQLGDSPVRKGKKRTIEDTESVPSQTFTKLKSSKSKKALSPSPQDRKRKKPGENVKVSNKNSFSPNVSKKRRGWAISEQDSDNTDQNQNTMTVDKEKNTQRASSLNRRSESASKAKKNELSTKDFVFGSSSAGKERKSGKKLHKTIAPLDSTDVGNLFENISHVLNNESPCLESDSSPTRKRGRPCKRKKLLHRQKDDDDPVSTIDNSSSPTATDTAEDEPVPRKRGLHRRRHTIALTSVISTEHLSPSTLQNTSISPDDSSSKMKESITHKKSSHSRKKHVDIVSKKQEVVTETGSVLTVADVSTTKSVNKPGRSRKSDVENVSHAKATTHHLAISAMKKAASISDLRDNKPDEVATKKSGRRRKTDVSTLSEPMKTTQKKESDFGECSSDFNSADDCVITAGTSDVMSNISVKIDVGKKRGRPRKSDMGEMGVGGLINFSSITKSKSSSSASLSPKTDEDVDVERCSPVDMVGANRLQMQTDNTDEYIVLKFKKRGRPRKSILDASYDSGETIKPNADDNPMDLLATEVSKRIEHNKTASPLKINLDDDIEISTIPSKDMKSVDKEAVSGRKPKNKSVTKGKTCENVGRKKIRKTQDVKGGVSKTTATVPSTGNLVSTKKSDRRRKKDAVPSLSKMGKSKQNDLKNRSYRDNIETTKSESIANLYDFVDDSESDTGDHLSQDSKFQSMKSVNTKPTLKIKKKSHTKQSSSKGYTFVATNALQQESPKQNRDRPFKKKRKMSTLLNVKTGICELVNVAHMQPKCLPQETDMESVQVSMTTSQDDSGSGMVCSDSTDAIKPNEDEGIQDTESEDIRPDTNISDVCDREISSDDHSLDVKTSSCHIEQSENIVKRKRGRPKKSIVAQVNTSDVKQVVSIEDVDAKPGQSCDDMHPASESSKDERNVKPKKRPQNKKYCNLLEANRKSHRCKKLHKNRYHSKLVSKTGTDALVSSKLRSQKSIVTRSSRSKTQQKTSSSPQKIPEKRKQVKSRSSVGITDKPTVDTIISNTPFKSSADYNLSVKRQLTLQEDSLEKNNTCDKENKADGSCNGSFTNQKVVTERRVSLKGSKAADNIFDRMQMDATVESLSPIKDSPIIDSYGSSSGIRLEYHSAVMPSLSLALGIGTNSVQESIKALKANEENNTNLHLEPVLDSEELINEEINKAVDLESVTDSEEINKSVDLKPAVDSEEINKSVDNLEPDIDSEETTTRVDFEHLIDIEQTNKSVDLDPVKDNEETDIGGDLEHVMDSEDLNHIADSVESNTSADLELVIDSDESNTSADLELTTSEVKIVDKDPEEIPLQDKVEVEEISTEIADSTSVDLQISITHLRSDTMKAEIEDVGVTVSQAASDGRFCPEVQSSKTDGSLPSQDSDSASFPDSEAVVSSTVDVDEVIQCKSKDSDSESLIGNHAMAISCIFDTSSNWSSTMPVKLQEDDMTETTPPTIEKLNEDFVPETNCSSLADDTSLDNSNEDVASYHDLEQGLERSSATTLPNNDEVDEMQQQRENTNSTVEIPTNDKSDESLLISSSDKTASASTNTEVEVPADISIISQQAEILPTEVDTQIEANDTNFVADKRSINDSRESCAFGISNKLLDQKTTKEPLNDATSRLDKNLIATVSEATDLIASCCNINNDATKSDAIDTHTLSEVIVPSSQNQCILLLSPCKSGSENISREVIDFEENNVDTRAPPEKEIRSVDIVDANDVKLINKDAAEENNMVSVANDESASEQVMEGEKYANSLFLDIPNEAEEDNWIDAAETSSEGNLKIIISTSNGKSVVMHRGSGPETVGEVGMENVRDDCKKPSDHEGDEDSDSETVPYKEEGRNSMSPMSTKSSDKMSPNEIPDDAYIVKAGTSREPLKLIISRSKSPVMTVVADETCEEDSFEEDILHGHIPSTSERSQQKLWSLRPNISRSPLDNLAVKYGNSYVDPRPKSRCIDPSKLHGVSYYKGQQVDKGVPGHRSHPGVIILSETLMTVQRKCKPCSVVLKDFMVYLNVNRKEILNYSSSEEEDDDLEDEDYSPYYESEDTDHVVSETNKEVVTFTVKPQMTFPIQADKRVISIHTQADKSINRTPTQLDKCVNIIPMQAVKCVNRTVHQLLNAPKPMTLSATAQQWLECGKKAPNLVVILSHNTPANVQRDPAGDARRLLDFYRSAKRRKIDVYLPERKKKPESQMKTSESYVGTFMSFLESKKEMPDIQPHHIWSRIAKRKKTNVQELEETEPSQTESQSPASKGTQVNSSGEGERNEHVKEAEVNSHGAGVRSETEVMEEAGTQTEVMEETEEIPESEEFVASSQTTKSSADVTEISSDDDVIVTSITGPKHGRGQSNVGADTDTKSLKDADRSKIENPSTAMSTCSSVTVSSSILVASGKERSHYQCKKCPYRAGTLAAVQKHAFSHCAILYPCTYCLAQFTSKVKASIHHRATHLDLPEKMSQTIVIDEKMDTWIERISDPLTSTSKPSETFQRESTAESVTKQSSSTSNDSGATSNIGFEPVVKETSVTSQIEVVKHLRCTYCTFCTSVEDEVRDHITDRHGNTNWYACLLCDKAFCRTSALIETHSSVQHVGRCMTYAKLPDYYNMEEWKIQQRDKRQNKGNVIERFGDASSVRDEVALEANGDEGNVGIDIDDLANYMRARDMVPQRESSVGQTSAEADSTTILNTEGGESGEDSDSNVTSRIEKIADLEIPSKTPDVTNEQSPEVAIDDHSVSSPSDSLIDTPIEDFVEMTCETVTPELRRQTVEGDDSVPEGEPHQRKSPITNSTLVPEDCLRHVVSLPNRDSPQVTMSPPTTQTDPGLKIVNVISLQDILPRPITTTKPCRRDNSAEPEVAVINESVKCPKCHIMLPFLEALNCHIKVAHKNLCIYTCPHCRQHITTAEVDMLSHIRQAHGCLDTSVTATLLFDPGDLSSAQEKQKSNEMYLCLLCGTDMDFFLDLFIHLKSNHEINPLYTCPYCHKFKSEGQDSVYVHMKCAHPNFRSDVTLGLSMDSKLFTRFTPDQTQLAARQRSTQPVGMPFQGTKSSLGVPVSGVPQRFAVQSIAPAQRQPTPSMLQPTGLRPIRQPTPSTVQTAGPQPLRQAIPSTLQPAGSRPVYRSLLTPRPPPPLQKKPPESVLVMDCESVEDDSHNQLSDIVDEEEMWLPMVSDSSIIVLEQGRPPAEEDQLATQVAEPTTDVTSSILNVPSVSAIVSVSNVDKLNECLESALKKAELSRNFDSFNIKPPGHIRAMQQGYQASRPAFQHPQASSEPRRTMSGSTNPREIPAQLQQVQHPPQSVQQSSNMMHFAPGQMVYMSKTQRGSPQSTNVLHFEPSSSTEATTTTATASHASPILKVPSIMPSGLRNKAQAAQMSQAQRHQARQVASGQQTTVRVTSALDLTSKAIPESKSSLPATTASQMVTPDAFKVFNLKPTVATPQRMIQPASHTPSFLRYPLVPANMLAAGHFVQQMPTQAASMASFVPRNMPPQQQTRPNIMPPQQQARPNNQAMYKCPYCKLKLKLFEVHSHIHYCHRGEKIVYNLAN